MDAKRPKEALAGILKNLKRNKKLVMESWK
jgi:hypothetical protein